MRTSVRSLSVLIDILWNFRYHIMCQTGRRTCGYADFFLFHFIILTSWSVHSSQLHVKYQVIVRTLGLTSELFVSLRREILRKSINISKELKKTRQVRQDFVTVSHRGGPYANKSQREKEHGNEKDLGHASLQRQDTLLVAQYSWRSLIGFPSVFVSNWSPVIPRNIVRLTASLVSVETVWWIVVSLDESRRDVMDPRLICNTLRWSCLMYSIGLTDICKVLLYHWVSRILLISQI